MALEKSLIEKMRRVTTRAAIAASKFRGLNDKIGADKAAVDVMRRERQTEIARVASTTRHVRPRSA